MELCGSVAHIFHGEDDHAVEEPAPRVAPGRRTLTMALPRRHLAHPAAIAPPSADASTAGADHALADADAAFGLHLADPSTSTRAGRPPGMLIDDDAEAMPGQLRRTAFLAELRAAVTRTAASVMGSSWSESGCPELARAFAHYATLDVARLERAVRAVTGVSTAVSAHVHVARVCARVAGALARWRDGEAMSWAMGPADLPRALDERAGDDGAAVTAAAMVGASSDAGAGGHGDGVAGVDTRAPIQRRRADATAAPPAASVARGAGQALPDLTRTKMERAFDADFGSVRVHVDDAAPALGALAYAQGEHVHVAPGHYAPDTPHGQELLGHELAHVVQQRQGRVRAPQGKGAPIDGDPALEAEADAAGAAAAAGRRVDGLLAGSGGAATAGADGAAIQRKVGFEVEVNILLSRGGPTQDLAAGEPEIVTGVDLMTGRYSDPAVLSSPYGRRMVLVKTKQGGQLIALQWHPGSRQQHDGGRSCLKPTAIPAEDPGRWLVLADWDPAGKPTARYFDPMLDKSQKVAGKSGDRPFDVVEDHVAQPLADELGSIIEFVTEPRDEFPLSGETPEDARERFLAPIRAVRRTVEQIKEAAGDKFDSRIPAARVFPGARADLYLGYDGISSQTHHGSLQATFGIQLAGVAGMMRERTEDFELLHEPQILGKAMKAAALTMQTLGWNPEEHPRLHGLFHLVCMYLVAGHPDYKNLCSLDKNHVPFLIRHGIPSIRTAGLSPRERDLLQGKRPAQGGDTYALLFSSALASDPSIVEVLARAADRTSGQNLFVFSPRALSVKAWIEAVLFGDSDPLMDDFWGEAKEIGPEPVGPNREEAWSGEPLPRETGAILEARHAAPGPQPPEAWEKIAESFLVRMNRHNR